MDYEERVLNGKDVFKSFLMVRISEAGERERGRGLGGAALLVPGRPRGDGLTGKRIQTK